MTEDTKQLESFNYKPADIIGSVASGANGAEIPESASLHITCKCAKCRPKTPLEIIGKIDELIIQATKEAVKLTHIDKSEKTEKQAMRLLHLLDNLDIMQRQMLPELRKAFE